MWDEVEDLDAIIGPPCSVSCEPTALLTAAWGIPQVSPACLSDVLTNKQTYPTFTRSVGPYSGNAPLYLSICKLFGWVNRVAIITTFELTYKILADSVQNEMEKAGIETLFYTLRPLILGSGPDLETLRDQNELVRKLKTEVRVIFIFRMPQDIRAFLVSAYDEGLMADGGYVFISQDMDLVLDAENTYRPETEEFIYTGSITVTFKKSDVPGYKAFQQDVVDAFGDPRFDDYPHIPVNSSTDLVSSWEGTECKSIFFHFIYV